MGSVVVRVWRWFLREMEVVGVFGLRGVLLRLGRVRDWVGVFVSCGGGSFVSCGEDGSFVTVKGLGGLFCTSLALVWTWVAEVGLPASSFRGSRVAVDTM